MAEHPGRPLKEPEAAALRFMVAPDFPGFAELREQARTARVVGGCFERGCGCPTIDLAVDRAETPPAVLGRQGMVASAWGREGGFPSLLLWARSGYLSGLELAWLDEFPDEFPGVDSFEPPELSTV